MSLILMRRSLKSVFRTAFDCQSLSFCKFRGLCTKNTNSENGVDHTADLPLEPESLMNRGDVIRNALDNAVTGTYTEPEFPSDFEKHLQRNQAAHSYRPAIDPETTSILLFPGQGSQYVGMGRKVIAFPGVEEMFQNASAILGYDLLDKCINGPKSELDKTVYCQPAILVCTLAALEKLKEEHPKALDHVVGAAGFSVGEIAALVVSEMIDFETAVRLVKIRAECMQKASEATPSGLLTVFCDHSTKLRVAMVAAREFCRQKANIEEPVCSIANYLCTNVKVVGGHHEALLFLEKYGKEWGLRRTKRLPVSGAFHTHLMDRDFFRRYAKCLDGLIMDPPTMPVHSNIDGKMYNGFANVISSLKKQVRSPVMWEQMLHIVYSRSPSEKFPKTYEVGPGMQLGQMLKATNARAYENYNSIPA